MGLPRREVRNIFAISYLKYCSEKFQALILVLCSAQYIDGPKYVCSHCKFVRPSLPLNSGVGADPCQPQAWQ